MAFAENLKRIRGERGLSQGELAEIIGMHSTHISRYERGQSNPTVEVLKKLTDALNVTADELIYGTADEKIQSRIKDPELLNMFTKAQSLATEDIQCIKSLLDAYILKTDLQKRVIL